MKLEAPLPWTHASPSQVRTFRRCPRRWWYEKIAGKRPPDKPAALLGKRVHDIAERWLRGELKIPKRRGELLQGADGEAMRIFAPGRKHLPQPPIDPTLIERWVGIPGTCEPFDSNPDGSAIPTEVVPLVGRVDLYDPEDTIPAVVDHKTTGNPDWVATPEQLLEDAQAAVYTRGLFFTHGTFWGTPETPEVFSEVAFRHVYYLTRGRPRSWVVEAVWDRARSDRVFGEVVETLREMAPLALEIEDEATKRNPRACRDYGGCPHKHYCNKRKRFGMGDSKQGLFAGLKNDDGLTLAERLAAQNKAMLSGGAGGPAEEPTPKAPADPGVAQAKAAEERLTKPLPDPDSAAARVIEAAQKRTSDPGQAKTPHTAERDPDPPNPPDGTRRDVIGDVGAGARRGLKVDGKLISKMKVSDGELQKFLGLPEKVTVWEAIARYKIDPTEAGKHGTRAAWLKWLATEVACGQIKRPESVEDQKAEAQAASKVPLSPEPKPDQVPCPACNKDDVEPGQICYACKTAQENVTALDAAHAEAERDRAAWKAEAPVEPEASPVEKPDPKPEPVESKTEPVEPEAEKPDHKLRFVLMIDCAPERWRGTGHILTMTELIEPFAREVEERHEMAYYAYEQYRYGQREIAERLGRAFAEGTTAIQDADVVLARSDHPAALEVIDVLSRQATTIIRGARS